MSQAGVDGDDGSSHQLLLRAGLIINEHRTSLVVVTGALLPALAVVFSVIGQELKDGGDYAWIAGAAAAIIVGGLLQLLSSWAAQQASNLDLVEVDRFRVTLKDALQPVAEMIADMELMNRADRLATLRNVATQAVGALKLIFIEIDRARATVYRLTESGDMECLSYQGRGEGVQPQPFKRHTRRGEQALAMVRAGEHMLIVNVDDVEVSDDGKVVGPDYRESRGGYKTFIGCSITNRDKPYGMVTVDAPEPGHLSDTDKQLVGLMADLLAIAFAIEERGSRSPKLGRAVGAAIENKPSGWQPGEKG